MIISSLQNQKVKQVVKLRRRSQRDKLDKLVVEGCREIKRALDNRYGIEELFYCPDWYSGMHEASLVERAGALGAQCIECSREVFAKLSYRDSPEGLLAVGPTLSLGLPDIHPREPAFLLVAEQIEKPGNLGTMLRAADAVDTDAVIVCDACTDINNPNVVRASIGALFTRPVVDATSAELADWLKARGIQTVAATPTGDGDYTEADYTKPTAVLVGSEHLGLSDFWMAHADLKVRIPMRGQCDSLNVSSAAAVMLYEVVRQRSKGQHGD